MTCHVNSNFNKKNKCQLKLKKKKNYEYQTHVPLTWVSFLHSSMVISKDPIKKKNFKSLAPFTTIHRPSLSHNPPSSPSLPLAQPSLSHNHSNTRLHIWLWRGLGIWKKKLIRSLEITMEEYKKETHACEFDIQFFFFFLNLSWFVLFY